MLCCAAGLSILGSPAVRAQVAGVTLAHDAAASLAVVPGQGVTVVLRLTSRARPLRDARLRAGLPSGWRAVPGEERLDIARGAADLRLVRLLVPSIAPAGERTVRFRLVDASGRVLALDSVTVRVRERHAAAVRLADAPRLVRAGERYTARFAVRNTGNAARPFLVEARSGTGLAPVVDTVRVWLHPGERRVLSASAATPAAITRSATHRVDLCVRDAGDSTVAACAYAVVTIVPAAGRQAPRLYRLPARLRVAAAATGRDARRIELRAHGPLADGGQSIVDLVLRGPTGGALGERDVYALSLTAPHYGLRLGDQSIALSPLTETGHPVFGADVDVHTGAARARVFGGRMRRGMRLAGAPVVGGDLGVRAGRRARLAVGYVQPLDSGAAGLWSARGALALLPGSVLEGEYAVGRRATAPGAWSARVTGSWSHLSLDALHLRGDTAFAGAASGRSADYVMASLRPWRRLALDGQLSTASSCPAARAGGRTCSGQRVARASASYGTTIALQYQATDRTSRLGPFAMQGSQRIGELRLAAGHGRARAGLTVSEGIVQGWLFAGAHPFHRIALTGSVPAGAGSIAAMVARESGGSLDFPLAADRWSGWVRANLRLGATTGARLTWHGTWVAGDAVPVQTLDAALEQRLPYGHRLTIGTSLTALGAKVAPMLGPGGAMVEAQYSMPLGLPVGFRRESGRVVGRVRDVAAGRGLPHVLVRLGGREALTDAEGRFGFSGLPSGTQYLEVDPASVGVGRLTVRPGPIVVAARAGRTVHVDIPVVRVAQIAGTVRLAPDSSGILDSSLVSAVGGVTVTLAGAGDTTWTITDANGRFLLADVRPGRYTARLTAIPLADRLAAAPDSIVLDVAPGSRHTLAFALAPAHRAIRMLTQGIVTLGSTPAAAAPAPAPAAAEDAHWEGWPPGSARIPHWYTVTRWDVGLVDIARKVYGNPRLWPKIWIANRDRLDSPDVIRAGQRLVIPYPAPLTREERAARDAYEARRRHR